MTTPVASAASSRHPWLLMPDPNLHTEMVMCDQQLWSLWLPAHAADADVVPYVQAACAGTQACRRHH